MTTAGVTRAVANIQQIPQYISFKKNQVSPSEPLGPLVFIVCFFLYMSLYCILNPSNPSSTDNTGFLSLGQTIWLMLSGALSLQLAMYPFLVDRDKKFSCDSRVRWAPFIHRPLWHKCDTSNCLPSAST